MKAPATQCSPIQRLEPLGSFYPVAHRLRAIRRSDDLRWSNAPLEVFKELMGEISKKAPQFKGSHRKEWERTIDPHIGDIKDVVYAFLADPENFRQLDISGEEAEKFYIIFDLLGRECPIENERKKFTVKNRTVTVNIDYSFVFKQMSCVFQKIAAKNR